MEMYCFSKLQFIVIIIVFSFSSFHSTENTIDTSPLQAATKLVINLRKFAKIKLVIPYFMHLLPKYFNKRDVIIFHL